MKQNGRVVIVARPPEEADSAETRSVRRGLEGLNRSLAKELGKQGVSSNLVYVSANAFDYLEWPLRFLMSNRSAYVTAQTLRVTHPDLVIDRPDHRGPGLMAGRRYVVTGACVVSVGQPQKSWPPTALKSSVSTVRRVPQTLRAW